MYSPAHPHIAAWSESAPPSIDFGRLAEESGGFSVDSWRSSASTDDEAGAPPSLETLQASARYACARIRCMYRVELEMTSHVKDGSRLNLELIDEHDGLKKFVLAYPRHIPPSESTSIARAANWTCVLRRGSGRSGPAWREECCSRRDRAASARCPVDARLGVRCATRGRARKG